jgi:ParB/RepB/Spo0J family partition protein
MAATKTKTLDQAMPKGEWITLPYLIPAKHNTRKIASPDADKALQASLKNNGQIQAGLARPHPTKKDHYELLAGCRRYRALKAIGARAMHVTIKKLDDDQAMAATLAENIDRNSLHPLDLSRQVSNMLKICKGKIEQAAKLLNQTPGEVKRLIAIESLTQKWKDAICDDSKDIYLLSLKHLIEVARLPAVIQDEVLAELEDGQFYELRSWGIGDFRKFLEGMRGSLADATWNLDDETLTEAGACSSCPKRTGADKDLWDNISGGDQCTDRQCFDEKRVAYLKRTVEEESKAKGVKIPLVLMNPGKRSRDMGPINEKLEADYNYGDLKPCKPDEKGAFPVIKVGDKDEGKTIFVKSSSSSGKTKTAKPAAVKPADMTPAMAEAALASRREQLKGKRMAHIIEAVVKLLEACKKNADQVYPNPSLMVWAFGLPWSNDHLECGTNPWKKVSKALKDSPNEGRAKAADDCMHGVVEIFVKRLKYHGLDGARDRESEVKSICEWLSFDLAKLAADATEACPEPKSWAALKERAAQAKTKPSVTTKEKTKAAKKTAPKKKAAKKK